MFGFLKKNGSEELLSPVTGKMIPLEKVKDEVFSSKMMGEGVAFELSENTVCSPVDGEITMIPESLHAFGVKSDQGAEVLVHVGLDTVNLGGRGFTKLVNQGAKVKKGTPILQVDRERLLEENMTLTTPMIVMNTSDFEVALLEAETVSSGETKVMILKKN
ncbi:PTS glucose transporter subunit IIA [Enterococcus sp.]|uniref:PTS sugar transporter subunit IIA n=1 Tax=Enterococcus sp. TaxID=35783 RepID=UPI00291224DE|nr:PTS glucose transporter subunit IIA [Enterococcus sp.]MDU5336753.1 PTS glucose transporter subunit IIA [Enterococcus sp.]